MSTTTTSETARVRIFHGYEAPLYFGAAGLALGAPAVTVAQAAETPAPGEGSPAAGDEDPRGVHPRFLL